MIKIKYVAINKLNNQLIIDVEEYPEKSWIFALDEITDINDFKTKLLAKEQEAIKQKQLIQDIQTLIDDKTVIK